MLDVLQVHSSYSSSHFRLHHISAYAWILWFKKHAEFFVQILMRIWYLHEHTYIYVIIPLLLGQAWASPTLVWLHCTQACACLLAQSNHLLKVTSGSYFVHFALWVNLKWTWRYEPWTVQLHKVARVIEVWQSVDVISHWWLTHGSCHWTRISFGYSNSSYW